jgi:hypothetical protein
MLWLITVTIEEGSIHEIVVLKAANEGEAISTYKALQKPDKWDRSDYPDGLRFSLVALKGDGPIKASADLRDYDPSF